jgi:hypothetical protein
MLTQKTIKKTNRMLDIWKIQYNTEEITQKWQPSLSITNRSSWFYGLYWQYLNPLENIKKDLDKTISIDKKSYSRKLALQRSSSFSISETGFVLADLVTVRLIIKNRYRFGIYHLKDLRASVSLEPGDVISNTNGKVISPDYNHKTFLQTLFRIDFKKRKPALPLEYN